MRVLVVGAGGVGSAAAAIAARRSFFSRFVIADFDPARAQRAVIDERFVAARARSKSAITNREKNDRRAAIAAAADPTPPAPTTRTRMPDAPFRTKRRYDH